MRMGVNYKLNTALGFVKKLLDILFLFLFMFHLLAYANGPEMFKISRKLRTLF